MYLSIIMFLGSILAPSNQNITECNGVVFLNQYYTKQRLFGSLNQPTNLVLHRYSDRFFFTHLDWKAYDEEKDTGAGHKIVVCNITKTTCTEVLNITDGHAIGYDPRTRRVFLGGKDGLYSYIPRKRSGFLITDLVPKVWHIFIQRNFYLIREKRLYILLNNNTFKIVPDAKDLEIENFFVSKGYSIYYSNSTGLFKADTITSPVYLLSNTVRVRQIAQDYRRGGVFFAANDGIYMDDIFLKKLTKVADINRLFGIIFRYVQPVGAKYKETQLLISDNRAIYLLKVSKHSEFCMGKKKNETDGHIAKLNTTSIRHKLVRFLRRQ